MSATASPDQTRRDVAAFFDREAARFPNVNDRRAHWTTRLANSLFRRSLRLRFDRVVAGCSEIAGKQVLDIGCGPGTYSIALARAGARRVVGIDIAPSMVEIANDCARRAGVGDQCEFRVVALEDLDNGAAFDYVIAMGIMDYVERAGPFVGKALSLTATRAFFSFPRRAGILAWQRRLRYRRRCPLFMYSRDDLDALFCPISGAGYAVESIARDWLVIAEKYTPL